MESALLVLARADAPGRLASASKAAGALDGGWKHLKLLIFAVQQQRPRCVRWLLKRGADPNAVHGTSYTTAVHCAAFGASSLILADVLAAGGDPNNSRLRACKPLHCAAMARRPDNVRVLLASGADVNAVTPTGDTALHRAIKHAVLLGGGGRLVCARLLLEAPGVDTDARTRLGRSAQDIADARGPDFAEEIRPWLQDARWRSERGVWLSARMGRTSTGQCPRVRRVEGPDEDLCVALREMLADPRLREPPCATGPSRLQTQNAIAGAVARFLR